MMCIVDEQDLEVAGLYDPGAPDAAERLELLEWLTEQGFAVEEMRAAQQARMLTALAADRALRPGVVHSTRDVIASLDLDESTLDEMRRAVGYPEADLDASVFTDQDIAAFANFATARKMFSEEAVVAFTRTLGSSLARIADAANSMFFAHVDRALLARDATELERAQATLEAIRMLDALRPTIEAIFLRHMELTVERSRRAREHATVAEGTDLVRMAIGFVDLSGYTSLSRRLDAQELSGLVERFEVVASDAALAHDGRVVKLVGDAVMYAAVECPEAVGIARRLLVAFADDPDVVPHGGIAYGEVLARGGDYYGPVVNTAARLSEVAVPGEVLVTRDVTHEVEGLEPAGRRLLRGFDDPVEVATLEL